MKTFVLLLGFLIAAPLSAQTPEATLDRATRAYEGVKTVRATFLQNIKNPLTGSDVSARGEFVQQRDRGLLSVRFTNPAGDRIVADGKHLWLYLPSTNPGQVLKLKATGGSSGTPDITAQFLEEPKGRYTVSDAGRTTVNGRAARALVLVPKGGDLPFTRATIWVDDADALVRQFELHEHSGIVRRITITSIQPNARVNPSAFTFTPPRGARVFDQSGTR